MEIAELRATVEEQLRVKDAEIAALRAEIDGRAAMALFLVAAVHCALADGVGGREGVRERAPVGTRGGAAR